MQIDVDELKARIKEDRRKATPTYGLHNDPQMDMEERLIL
jgi:hypothetical protein